ncbi:rhodanese-like domain-containing protein [Tahibacter caeni]|uniref:rhodanese-like domain-containing protein n=1 Tax=Tahibacter caeni TaxID=1453545 RepID=UPI002148D233|nr:rhodanese-like domain-containing protein [Tahibacter caeni]
MTTVQELVAQARGRIREISIEEMLALQRAGVPVVDVREPDEYSAGHVPGAVGIPRGVLEFEVDGHPAVNGRRDPALSHRDAPLVLVCRSGGRSALAADALRRLGFAQPLSLAGGLNAWLAEGRPLAADGQS